MSETAAQDRTDAPSGERTGCGDCKPHLIDCLKCKTEGIAKQAEYNAATQPDLDAAQVAYNATRKDYRAKRADVTLQVQDMRHQIKHLVERVRCLIQQEHVVECLDDAWCCIAKELDKCSAQVGCCADDLECEFDVSGEDWDCEPDDDDPRYVSDAEYTALVAKITAYQDHVDRAKACFNTLIGEPAALVVRVAAVKAEVDAINAALTADPATTDLKKVYAQALVARRHIRLIWNGFDQSKDFVECLCRALTCWSTGSAAVSLLTGKRAFEDCKRAAAAAQCLELQTNTVDEILARYEKCCPPPDCDDPKPVDPDCPPDDDDCDDSKGHKGGCEHDHHHHHDHKHDENCDHDHDDDDDGGDPPQQTST